MRFDCKFAKRSLHFQPLEGNSTYCKQVAAIEQVVVTDNFELNTRIVVSKCSNVVTLVVKDTEKLNQYLAVGGPAVAKHSGKPVAGVTILSLPALPRCARLCQPLMESRQPDLSNIFNAQIRTSVSVED